MILQNNSSISLFHKISSAIDNVILLDFRCKFLSILGPSGENISSVYTITIKHGSIQMYQFETKQ